MTNQDPNNTGSDQPIIEVETLQQELSQMKEMAMRALADLQNYKKQADEERTRLISLGEIKVLTELMPVIDNFSRAFQHIPEDLSQNDWIKGIQHIQTQLLNILKNVGLEEIPSVGHPVNPNLHEIISTAEGEKDIILNEIEKGYTFQGKVLRASKVIVGS